MKRPQTKFHAHTMRESQVIRSKKRSKFVIRTKFFLGQTIFAAQIFLCNIDILLKLQQQILICLCKFSSNSVIITGFIAISDIIMLFCPPGRALAGAGPNARLRRGAQCKT